MNLNEIKKVLYKEKPIAKQTAIYRDGGSKDFETNTSLGIVKFHVPFREQYRDNNVILKEFTEKEIPAQLLIKWIQND